MAEIPLIDFEERLGKKSKNSLSFRGVSFFLEPRIGGVIPPKYESGPK